MNIRIALAGNPNSGKTTLFNALTGSNQFVGNWPASPWKEGRQAQEAQRCDDHPDLSRYLLRSPYTLEEVVARNYLIGERPDAILNIVDGTNLELQPVPHHAAHRVGHPGRHRHQHDGRCPQERRQDQRGGIIA